MKKELTAEEIAARFAEVDALGEEPLTPDEAAGLAEAEAMDDGTTISYDELRDRLDGYSGRLVLRIPRSLHKALKEEAAVEGVSLNQYMLYKLAR